MKLNVRHRIAGPQAGFWKLMLVVLTALAVTLPGAVTRAQSGLSYTTSWVGNTYGGTAKWVQSFIEDIDVTPGGVVVTAAGWDEAGRCTGLYKDGDVNTTLLKQYNGAGGHVAWCWGTASLSAAADDNGIYMVNTNKELLKFTWNPSDINSASYATTVSIGGDSDVVGMVARGGKLYFARQNGEVQIRNTSDLSLVRSFTVDSGVVDLAVDGNTTLWIIIGTQIKHYSDTGGALSGTITDVAKPMSVSIDNQGRLVVTDDGPRQQVLFYSNSGTPSLVRTFGVQGGLRAGTPGVIEPQKLFALRGAGTDSSGNLYVALSHREAIIRKFTPDGTLVWELQSHPFVDTYDASAASDATEVYGNDELFTLDFSKPTGQEWSLKAITRDLITYPNDPRANPQYAGTAMIRTLNGKRVLYNIGQYAGGFDIFVFEDAPSQIARPAGSVTRDGGWAWEVQSNGDIWQGEAPNSKIRRYPFQGFDSNGNPIYNTASPDETTIPAPFDRIQRIKYIPETDTMYLSGYTPDKPEVSWGLIGSVLARYDNWKAGNRTAKYVIDLPKDDAGLHPKSLDVAGDYIFAVMVQPTGGKPAMVHVWNANTGNKVGTMVPGPEVGGDSGWVDMPYGLRAYKRSNGEYIVLVEEDARAKNLMYRWCPSGNCASTATPTPTRTPTPAPTATPTATPPSGGSGTGLKGEYYDNIDFTALKLTRTDATVDFDWGSGAPDPSMGADTFSVRWTGQVEAPVSGSYTFYTTSDDGVRLWVNGQQLINNWTDHPPTENSGTITLTAGQKYDLKLEFYENGGGAVAKLAWAYPGQSKQIIPQSRLYPPPSGGSGTGLKGEYYDNIDFTALKLTRTDATVDFDWGSGAPDPSMGADTFSVRWTGQVEAPVSGSYTFYTTSDDGVRLWVNGQQLINNWTDHPPTENSGTITLTAGQKYDLKLEFYENGGGAVAKLAWAYPGQSKQIIPQSRLYPPTSGGGGTSSYEAEANGNTISGGAQITGCGGCSGGQKVNWIGNGGYVTFNNVSGSAGSATLTIYYTNGSGAARTFYVSINGGSGTSISCPATADWATVGSVTMTVSLNAGSNTIRFYNDSAGAPDLDRITITQ
jgi:hypothetical protein